MLKQRTPEQIRRDAIGMGLKKAQYGCPACAEKYFDLARLYGSSEEEILTALEEATGMHKRGLKRRELIKYLVAGAGGEILNQLPALQSSLMHACRLFEGSQNLLFGASVKPGQVKILFRARGASVLGLLEAHPDRIPANLFGCPLFQHTSLRAP